MAEIVVVGAGIAGLGAALALDRGGHRVTVLERDATPLPDSPEAAFRWDRRGAPQVRHSHALLARLRNLLRDDDPALLAALHEAGVTEIDFASALPPAITDRAPRPGDEDLVALAGRRTTFEWVLRREALSRPGIRVRDGVAVSGLVADGAAVPRVTGVATADGGRLDADLVAVAGGARSALASWLHDAGVAPLPERVEETGILYASRFYRLHPGVEAPGTEGPIAGDVGYLKFAVFPGDNRTFSVTLAVGVDDRVMRRCIADPDTFDAVAARLVPTAAWVDPALAGPITGVATMSGLVNRRRRFVVDGRPLVLGLAAVGDAHTCTNPLYGRGCTTAMLSARALAGAVDVAGGDHEALAHAYHEAMARDVEPWFKASVGQDRLSRAAAEPSAQPAGGAARDDAGETMRAGLMAATRVDPVVYRAFVRMFNMLDTPETLLRDPEVMQRVMAVWNDREALPPPARLGPRREDLLAELSSLRRPQG